jgi:hypothetical protein
MFGLLLCRRQPPGHVAGNPRTRRAYLRIEARKNMGRMITIVAFEDVALKALHENLRVGVAGIQRRLQQILQCHHAPC